MQSLTTNHRGFGPFTGNDYEENKSTTATLIIGGAMFGALYATMIWMAL